MSTPARLGRSPLVRPSTKIVGLEHLTFGTHVMVDDFVLISARAPITIGNYVHIACFASITGGEHVNIGDYCAVSQGARLLTATDDFTDWGFGNSTIDEEFRTRRATKPCRRTPPILICGRLALRRVIGRKARRSSWSRPLTFDVDLVDWAPW